MPRTQFLSTGFHVPARTVCLRDSFKGNPHRHRAMFASRATPCGRPPSSNRSYAHAGSAFPPTLSGMIGEFIESRRAIETVGNDCCPTRDQSRHSRYQSSREQSRWHCFLMSSNRCLNMGIEHHYALLRFVGPGPEWKVDSVRWEFSPAMRRSKKK